MRNFIYTQTRLQARHGMRPDERTWRLVESQKDLVNFLQSARQTRISPWVTGLQATDSHHLIESTLLKHYCDYVQEVAAWVPDNWRNAVQWVVCLTYLPAIQHLIAGNTAYGWMLEDVRIKLATTTQLEQRMGYLLQSEFSPLFKNWNADKSLLDCWLEHWQRLWPAKKGRQQQTLNELINGVIRHRDVFGQLPVERTWQQRQQLVFKLTMMFRRNACYPVNVFVHLLLVALDVERLRGTMMQRCLFNEFQEATA